jgi:hypothetical protein
MLEDEFQPRIVPSLRKEGNYSPQEGPQHDQQADEDSRSGGFTPPWCFVLVELVAG